MQVEIVEFPPTRVAILRHAGPPERLPETLARFIAWRRHTGLSPVTHSDTFGIAPLDPATTPPEAFRFDLCGSVTAPIPEDNAYGVVNGWMPAGRCARLRHVGAHDQVGVTVQALLGDWLPASGEARRDAPLFVHYLDAGRDVPAHARVTEIYLPLAPREP